MPGLGIAALFIRTFTFLETAKSDKRIQLFSEDNSYFLFQAILNNHIDRDLVVVKLREFGIGTSVHYAKPVPLMKYYKDKYDLLEQNYPSAVEYGKQVISFPVHSNMTEEDVTYVCDHLKAIIG